VKTVTAGKAGSHGGEATEARWSCPELVAELTALGITDTISASTVRRWLREDAIKPWQNQSWIFIRDPDFRAKAQRVLNLYARTFEGVPLGEDEYVISSDEKTSVQARCRCHPTLAPGQARASITSTDAGGCPGLPGCLRRPPGEGYRPLRAHHRHRALY
jgi:hypothetical protein